MLWTKTIWSPADPLRKEQMALTVSTSVTGEIEECSQERRGMHESGCNGGCLDWKTAKVASSSSTVEVSEQVRRTAAL